MGKKYRIKKNDEYLNTSVGVALLNGDIIELEELEDCPASEKKRCVAGSCTLLSMPPKYKCIHCNNTWIGGEIPYCCPASECDGEECECGKKILPFQELYEKKPKEPNESLEGMVSIDSVLRVFDYSKECVCNLTDVSSSPTVEGIKFIRKAIENMGEKK